MKVKTLFLLMIINIAFLRCPDEFLDTRKEISMHEPGTIVEEGQHFIETPDIPGIVPHEAQEPINTHVGYPGTGQDVLHYQDEDTHSLLSESGLIMEPQRVVSSQIAAGASVVDPEPGFVPLEKKEGIFINLDEPIKKNVALQQDAYKRIDSYINAAESVIADLNKKSIVSIADYSDPLSQLENAREQIEFTIESWDDLWAGVDGVTIDQANSSGDLFDAILNQLDRTESLLEETKKIMKSRSVKDISNLYQELQAIQKDVSKAQTGGVLWGKKGSLRKAAERIERLRFILEAASKTAPDGLPVSDPNSYQHIVNNLKEILTNVEQQLQMKQMAELQKKDLIDRSKASFEKLNKLTSIPDYTNRVGKQIIKEAKKVVKELSDIITTDLDYQNHILEEHESKAFDILAKELVRRGIISNESEMTSEILEKPAVREIGKQLFEGKSGLVGWRNSVDYVLVHRLKVNIEEKIRKITEGLQIIRKEYGRSGVKRIRRNSPSSISSKGPTRVNSLLPVLE